MYRPILFTLMTLVCCGRIERPKEVLPKALPVKEVVFNGLKHPWSIAFLSEEEALVTEKDGDLVKVNLSTKAKQVIQGFPTDLTDSIRIKRHGDNSGIFEVVIHPDFDTNAYIYLSYAAKRSGEGTTTKVVRARLDGTSLHDVITILEAGPFTREYYHYGGGMVFGADGKLYITVGERLFWEKDEPEIPIAQDVKDKRGKIYRFNSDGRVPKDNPDFGEGAVPGLYALGIRAAQGIAMQPVYGNLWFSEHGTIRGDEINLLKPGANYGWPLTTSGELRSKDYVPPKLEVDLTPPTWYWPHTVAPTGLTFYTGDEFPEWKNDLLVPGLSRGSFWRFRIEKDVIKSAEELFLDSRVRSRKIAQSPEGKLYMLTDEPNGKIVRIKNAAVSYPETF
ncbi:PQQ-dependent sugar dehydrogenase [Fulvivirga sp. M361]|uniref:PQQ-dependent sugar dehydrogenase n=1 Tax=Fulvivirga sp. M361 TaxID=2594266 RepID=UPI0011798F33|nr:PQQ-dependent sugar dehydrogenase [Fulvivirga sp. M361]TRX62593.1 PQQ-dependent sugar dehydrogenase [Fulvivirga sp. M361]